MDVGSILGYVVSLMQQLGLTPAVTAVIIILLAIIIFDRLADR